MSESVGLWDYREILYKKKMWDFAEIWCEMTRNYDV
jgi:hypothetical protein